MSLLSAVLQEANKVTSAEFKKHRDVLFPKIKDITERVQMLSWGLQQNLIDTYVNYTVTKSLEQLNYKNRRANIECDYETISQDVGALRKQFESFDEDFNNNWQKLCNSYELFKKMCIAAEGKNILSRANHEFGRYNYSEAILNIKRLKDQIKDLCLDGNLQKAISNLNDQAENQLSLYMAKLSLEWEEIFSWCEQKGVRFVKYCVCVEQSDAARARRVLRALHDTGRLHAALGPFAQYFTQQLLHHVLRHNCDIYNEDHIGAIIFNIQIDINDTKTPNYQTIFNNLTAIFEFLQSTLGSHFDGNSTFIEVFAESIRDKFFNKLINDCIRNNLPACDATYQSYKDIVVELDSFNRFLIDLRFVDATASPLNKYIDDTEHVLYEKKCDKLLSDIRLLLNERLSRGTVTVGSDADTGDDSVLDHSQKQLRDVTNPIFLPKCVISENVKRIVSLIVEQVEESARWPERHQRLLVARVRDAAVMYECSVQRVNVTLDANPTDIAVLFNNCMYVSHGVAGAGRALPAGRGVALVAPLQDLRVRALHLVARYLHAHTAHIVHSVEDTHHTTGAWCPDGFERFERGVRAARRALTELSDAWRGVAPARVTRRAVCGAAQALCGAVLVRVLRCAGGAPEPVMLMVAQAVHEVQRHVREVVRGVGGEECGGWARLGAVARGLRAAAPLEVAALWRDGHLAQLTCEEVRQIVKMRFPDDKYTLKILKEIQ